jgi:hypothetical protein
VIVNKTGEFILGRAMADNQDFVARLQSGNDRRQIALAVMRVAGTDRTGFMMNVAVSVRCLDPVFGHIGFGKLEDCGFCMIYRDDSVEMVRHLHSRSRFSA